ncbi:MoaD/ThiS family protein [Desulfocastanea catecholica]
MRVRVRLFGTLPRYFPGNYPNSGLDVEIWKDISVAELVDLLQLPKEQVAIVSINGTLANAADTIPDNTEVKFFQPLNGG